MRKRGWKSIVAFLAGISVAVTAIPKLEGSMRTVKAESEIHITGNADMETMLKLCNDNYETVTGILEADITDARGYSFTNGEVELDLNGHTLSGAVGSGAVITGNGVTIKITDSMGSGKIENSGTNGSVLTMTGGTLSIEGGTLAGNKYVAVDASGTGTTVNITGGNLSGELAALRIGSGCKATISGEPVLSGNNEAVFVPDDASGAELTIEGGTFYGNENGSFSYVCNFGGTNNTLKIRGGTFNLSAAQGSSLVIGSNITDESVSIEGGTFNGRIARMKATTGDDWDYTAYYGDVSSSGILAEGYVLTDNTLTDLSNGRQENSVFTADRVAVVPGALLRFNTGRSTLETYSDAESQEADKADYYSLAPVSVGTDGTVYTNSGSSTVPVIATDRITNGNTYTFSGWMDEKGKEYSSASQYISEGGTVPASLIAVWQATVGTDAGLQSAVENTVIKAIEVSTDITTSLSMTAQQGSLQERTMDLATHKISYTPSTSNNPAFVLDGAWTVKNGTIESNRQACIQIGGSAVLEDLICKTDGFSYAVGFGNGTAGSKVVSGTFENTTTDGYALWVANGTAADITALFQGAYASCTAAKTEGANVYLNAAKLLVSKTPITYPADGETLDMGTFVYGEALLEERWTISNQAYSGDITITDISIDNDVFTVTGEDATKTLPGGSEETYSYLIETTENPVPGDYEGTVSVKYTKMDGTEGIYKQKVTMTVEPKPLTVAEPGFQKTKAYDGSDTVEVTVGIVTGVLEGEDVSVTAEAAYDNADVGTGKTISVKYILTGADKDHYLAPEDKTYNDGIIEKAEGSASVTIQDCYVGETLAPTALSETNGTESVTYYYKQKSAPDNTYTIVAPKEEGSYTLKAVFAETKNYHGVEATADFTLSYIATPENPYTLEGKKGNEGWYTSEVTIRPAKGYRISTEKNGIYQEDYTVESSTEPVIYLKSETGAVTRPIQVEKLQIDANAPIVTGIKNGATYYVDRLTFTIADDNLEAVTVDGKAVAFQGSTVTVSLQPTGKKCVIAAKDKAGNASKYTITVEEAWMKDGIISNGSKRLVRGKAYKLGSGQWKVDSDNTVYNGGTGFYVNTDGDYDFQKQ